MVIKETEKYKKTYKKCLLNKHMNREIERLSNIKNLIIATPNFHKLLLSEYKNVYHIEKKNGSFKEYYSARLNSKIRLLMRPVGEYPYKEIEIDEIIFEEIMNNHYGEG